jgi:transposase
LSAVEILRQVWGQQFWRDDEQVRWRDVKQMPTVGEWIRSPFDIEARYCTKRSMGWVGYKVHLSETCDDEQAHLITQVSTTVSTVQDCQMTSAIQADLAQRDLLPSDHLVDAGYVDAQQLLNSQQEFRVNLIGPAPLDTSWQAQAANGFEQSQFQIDWDPRIVTCPMGQTSYTWQPAQSSRQIPLIRVAFARESCQTCAARIQCTRGQARGMTFRPREPYEALQAARQREQSDEFKESYRKRAGVEGTISQATRTGDIRRSRYIGLAKTHLQNLAIAAAINLHRIINHLNDVPVAATRQSRFAALVA